MNNDRQPNLLYLQRRKDAPDESNRVDTISRGTAGLAVLVLMLALAMADDWSGVVALFVGIALGVANSQEIREFFR